MNNITRNAIEFATIEDHGKEFLNKRVRTIGNWRNNGVDRINYIGDTAAATSRATRQITFVYRFRAVHPELVL